jgi:prepilin-type N-terminal cleavage/methylation domain-containing protein
MFPTHTQYRRGVTLVEILVAISIIGLIASFVLASFGDFRARKTLDASVEGMLSAFSHAHLDTISSKNDQQYGVHIAADQVVYFVGPTYATGTATNIIHSLHSVIEIANISLNGGGSDVLYQRLSGKTNQYGTFQLRPRSRPTMTATITINETGATSI